MVKAADAVVAFWFPISRDPPEGGTACSFRLRAAGKISVSNF